MKKQQQKIEMILEGKKIKCCFIDIASSTNAKERMRDIIGDPKALPPQLFNNGEYCGVSRSILLLPSPPGKRRK